jgi:hypothetical protein
VRCRLQLLSGEQYRSISSSGQNRQHGYAQETVPGRGPTPCGEFNPAEAGGAAVELTAMRAGSRRGSTKSKSGPRWHGLSRCCGRDLDNQHQGPRTEISGTPSCATPHAQVGRGQTSRGPCLPPSLVGRFSGAEPLRARWCARLVQRGDAWCCGPFGAAGPAAWEARSTPRVA